MNFTKSIFLAVAVGVFSTSCKQTDSAAVTDVDASKTEAVAAKTETASFNIEGMSCAVMCANGIEKKLAKMDGVEQAKVNFETKTATVKFDAAKQSTEKLVQAVEAYADGKTYKVSNVKSSGDQAMVYDNDNDKEKGKKKKSKKKKGEAKAGCSPEEKAAAGKPACCAAKKACSA